MVQGWINLILGIWLIVSGIFTTLHHPINMVITGILAMVFGFWLYKMWQGFVVGLLGLWTILSGLVLNLIVPANLIIVGLVMGLLGLWIGLGHLREMKTKAA